MPHARHERGKLWELRITVGRRDYRVLYAAVTGRTFILLHGFAKQTPKTPARELDTAERRLADYLARQSEGS
jgi:phage-related protein